MGSTNLQSRKWLLTVNNPLDYGLNHAEIKNILHLFNPDYFCLVDEIATTGTRHTHIFIYSKSPIRFSTLKKRFPIAQIDKANGSVIENRDYLRKDGKWKGSDKEHTNLIDTFEEFGDVPKPVDENSPDMSALIEEIENGLDTYEIIKLHPKYAFRIKKLTHSGRPYFQIFSVKRNGMLPFTMFTESQEQAKQWEYIKNTERPIFAELLLIAVTQE